LGYINVAVLILRLQNALQGMSVLERHRGHFLNWYDTRTLEPWPPR
jgi:cyclic beta-1,2-glucan synthetase